MGLRRKIKNFLYTRKFSKKKYLTNINKKNILITGANSGIGLALTKRLLELDNKILAIYRENSENLTNIKDKNLSIIKYDLKKINKSENFEKKIKETSVDLILNCAGVFGPSFENQQIESLDFEKFQEVLMVNSISILKKGIADIANIHMQFKSGLKSDISVSWFNATKQVKLEVYGRKGILIFDDTKDWDEKLSIFPYKANYKNKNVEIKKFYHKFLEVPEEEPLKIECQHFIDIQKIDVNPLTDIEEGIRVIKVLSAASKFYEKKRYFKKNYFFLCANQQT